MDIVLTGVVRSGTTLACHLLNTLPDVIALHEPMNPVSLLPLDDDARLDAVQSFFDAQRRSLLSSGTATSMALAGCVPDNPYGSQRDERGLRRSVVSLEEVRFDKPLTETFTLVVKHPNAFTALLPVLVRRFPVRALVRNPLAILLSMSSTAAHWTGGRVPVAEAFDAPLAAALDAEMDVVTRQVRIITWSFGQYATCLPRTSVIRYEDVIASGGEALATIVPSAAALSQPLGNMNRNPLYDRGLVEHLAVRLLESDGAQWDFYSREDVASLRSELLAG